MFFFIKTNICGSRSGHPCWPVCTPLEPTMCIRASAINQGARMVTWSNESHTLLHYMHGWVSVLFRDTGTLRMSGLQPRPPELHIPDLERPFMVFSDVCELFQQLDASWHKGEDIWFGSKMAATFFIKYLCKWGLLKRSFYPSARRINSLKKTYWICPKCGMVSKSHRKSSHKYTFLTNGMI